MTTPAYPERGPWTALSLRGGLHLTRPSLQMLPTQGWHLSAKHAGLLRYHIQRLEELSTLGWEVSVQLDVMRGSKQQGPASHVAMLNVFVNGSCCGYTLVPGRTFDDVPEADKRWFSIRVYGMDLPAGTKRTLGACVSRVMELLPQHITDLLEHFSRYTDSHDPVAA